jgi:glycosyltransferase involved in cell wall biosynthesis
LPVDADHPYLISAVIATYNVARYLPDFLASLDRQTFAIDGVQLIFVDDGSTDDGLSILQEWQRTHGEHVVVITQENRWEPRILQR